MKILIIGASGLVGSHCLNYFKTMGLNTVGTHLNYETKDTVYFNPIEDNNFDFLNVIDFQPNVIVHCGALTNVDYCEENQKESYLKTVDSAKVISKYCDSKNIKIIYISTDYVFDGIDGPYKETAKTNPLNVYGKHKLEAENNVNRLNDFIIARITNVYGEEERSKNFIANILTTVYNKSEKTYKLPFDQFATPIYAGDIARMLYLLIKDNKKGVYHFGATDYYNRVQLAKKVISYFSDKQNITIQSIATKDLYQKAPRPLNGGLLNIKFTNEYPDFEFTNIDTFILNNKNNI